MNTDPALVSPRRFDWRVLPALAGGAIWLGASDDVGGFFLALLPGLGLIGSSVGALLWPGSPKCARLMALAAMAGVILAIPGFFVDSVPYGVVVLVLSGLACLCAGRLALLWRLRPAGVPAAPRGWLASAKAALDAALMGYFVLGARSPGAAATQDLAARAARLKAALDAGSRPPGTDSIGTVPPPPVDARMQSVRVGKMDGERLSFESGYELPPDFVDAPAWLADAANARCEALVYRQAGSGPGSGRGSGQQWLLGIHGYRMGPDWLNSGLFPPRRLMPQLACNLVLPVLPLHGHRKVGLRTGDQYMDGDLLNVVYAQAQALWDLRRILAWIRVEDPQARIGVMGYSLGSLSAALLANCEPQLDFVVAGIPLVDPAAIMWTALAPVYRRYFVAQGLDAERYAALFEHLSPLARPALLLPERLAVFAGTADCVVPPDQPQRLADHWSVPVRWYAGGHLTFRGESVVMHTLHDVAALAGWTPGGGPG